MMKEKHWWHSTKHKEIEMHIPERLETRKTGARKRVSRTQVMSGPEKDRFSLADAARWLTPSSRSSWEGGRPGCWARHLHARW
ncbi:hypothetical protein ANAPC5_01442 [Anaplasma phagocytophilum]|nr:hypothetical protein ANAPC5_01442 [Anaplasma phagocytophilum]